MYPPCTIRKVRTPVHESGGTRGRYLLQIAPAMRPAAAPALPLLVAGIRSISGRCRYRLLVIVPSLKIRSGIPGAVDPLICGWNGDIAVPEAVAAGRRKAPSRTETTTTAFN